MQADNQFFNLCDFPSMSFVEMHYNHVYCLYDAIYVDIANVHIWCLTTDSAHSQKSSNNDISMCAA